MKPTNHGLRHNKIVQQFVAKTKDEQYVTLELNGVAVIRQAKHSHGQVFHQGTNPDYKGRRCYPLQYLKNNQWRSYDHQARQGDIRTQLPRLLECLKG